MLTDGQACTVTKLLDPASAANTAAATSAWTDISKVQGDIMFTFQTGAVTGSVAPRIETAYDAGGTGAAAVSPNDGDFTNGVTANTCQKRCINSNSAKGFVRIVGAITTGPAFCSATMSTRLRA
jgi:hypothetical protein